MEIYCTRPNCPRPLNLFSDLDDPATLKRVSQKYCMTCGMPLILRDRYLPLKLLGQGGFGVAVLARDRDTPAMRRCVVKLFKPAGYLTPQQFVTAQNLFSREAEVLEELGNQHPQIPELFAFFELNVPSFPPGKQDQFFYLVQEYIDGEDLEEELDKKGKFSENEVLEVLRQILSVLQFVHEQGSIHRDIKPSNIMRDRQGRLYLLDFGAVKQVTKVASTGGSTGIYSMGFAPPEQMSGSQVYPSTDLYALAVTCLTLLTGKEPKELFDSYTNKWNWRNFVQVSDRNANVLDRMLLPTPNLRFKSAQEVLAALTPHQPPQTPPPPSISQPTVPPPSTTQPPLTAVAQPTSMPSRRAVGAFSTLELLGNGGFSGMMAGLLGIALHSLLGLSPISIGLGMLILGGLIFAQYRRTIEKVDLLIIGGIGFAIVWFLPFLRAGLAFPDFVILVIGAGLLAIAVTALFRLIYKLLSIMF
ncbi:protein kinase domain-containing protein [Argonema galeatum]|uniref:protein kinase domain-containing protein n=1 Tax=Argonema galeatum TaxID=2942762 RepID=UPI0020133405|nr:protein kinase [Argonema galeatum]MCL1464378.1 protein kinase [Argonema galeatum A003/A1]